MMEDRIVVWFEPQKGKEIKDALLKFGSLVGKSQNVQERNLIRREIPLNRPDTMDEGEFNQYLGQTHLLSIVLKVSASSVDLQIASFPNLPPDERAC